MAEPTTSRTNSETTVDEGSDLERVAERGRKLIVRAVWVSSLVYTIKLLVALHLRFGKGMFVAALYILVIVMLGTIVVRRKQKWARWALIAALLVCALEWSLLIPLGDPIALLAVPSLLASAAAVASGPSRRFIERG